MEPNVQQGSCKHKQFDRLVLDSGCGDGSGGGERTGEGSRERTGGSSGDGGTLSGWRDVTVVDGELRRNVARVTEHYGLG